MRKIETRESRATNRAAHFTPGNVILSGYWRTHDLVLAYYPGDVNEADWEVKVQHVVRKDGKWVADGYPRIHATEPDRNDKIVETGVPFA